MLLVAQLLAPFLLVLLPVGVFVVLIAFGIYPGILVIQLVYILITFYGLTNSIMTIFFVAPFRGHLFGYLMKLIVAMKIKTSVVKIEASEALSGNVNLSSIQIQQRAVIIRHASML
jgi:hypothetical protein